jgi:orotate phosphoribosyltransferase
MTVYPNDHLETLRQCGGYYSCPKDGAGRRLGPLVGYAGKYPTSDGEKQWVGDVYANFAKADEYPSVLFHYAFRMEEKLALVVKDIDIFCGAPIGGYDFSKMLGLIFDRRAIKAEKKVTALATANAREQSELVFARHGIEKDVQYAIVEDVCNNFSTTEKLIALIMAQGGKVSAITCLLNRSLDVTDYYHSKVAGRDIPVISLVRLSIPEYRQDDPAVAEDIKSGNVAWKPKDEWSRLMQAMSDHA